jgi:hypothetical protein
LFADQENKLPFSISVCSKQIEVFCFHFLYIYIYMLPFRRKAEAQAISPNPLPFAHHANGSLSFVHLLTKKQTKVIRVEED